MDEQEPRSKTFECVPGRPYYSTDVGQQRGVADGHHSVHIRFVVITIQSKSTRSESLRDYTEKVESGWLRLRDEEDFFHVLHLVHRKRAGLGMIAGKKLSGISLITTPSGSVKKPKSSEMPHCSPLKGTTVSAVPPTKMISIWPPIITRMTIVKTQFRRIPSKTFNLLSSRRLLRVLKICIQTKPLNRMVRHCDSGYGRRLS